MLLSRLCDADLFVLSVLFHFLSPVLSLLQINRLRFEICRIAEQGLVLHTVAVQKNETQHSVSVCVSVPV